MSSTETKNLELLYTLFCDDVRLEAGNKLSFMGVFQNIMVQQLPVSLIKFAIVNHWKGEGTYFPRSASSHRIGNSPWLCPSRRDSRSPPAASPTTSASL